MEVSYMKEEKDNETGTEISPQSLAFRSHRGHVQISGFC